MTRKNAIKTLKELWRETNDSWYKEVYSMAINALDTDRKIEPTISSLRDGDFSKPSEWMDELTEYEKSILTFGELLFNKDKQEEFVKDCEKLGIKVD